MAKNEPILRASVHTPARSAVTDRCYSFFSMRKINLNEIKEEPWQSPGGKYAVSFKGISEALGANRARLICLSGIRLIWNGTESSGKSNFPYHAHSAQWELYLVVSGKGTVRHKDGKTEVVPATRSFSDQTNRINYQLWSRRPHLLCDRRQPDRRIRLLS